MMAKYQVWLRGCVLTDWEAKDEQDARRQAREWLGVKRLPNGTGICQISYGYYDEIIRMNREAGFHAGNF